jgi:hypothetical protein
MAKENNKFFLYFMDIILNIVILGMLVYDIFVYFNKNENLSQEQIENLKIDFVVMIPLCCLSFIMFAINVIKNYEELKHIYVTLVIVCYYILVCVSGFWSIVYLIFRTIVERTYYQQRELLVITGNVLYFLFLGWKLCYMEENDEDVTMNIKESLEEQSENMSLQIEE